MTPPVSEEMIRAAWQAFKPHQYGTNAYMMVGIEKAVTAALAHFPAGSEAVKPVAYLFRERFRDGKGGWWNWSSWSASAEEVAVINQDHMQLECIAVFAAPPSTPPAANVQEGDVENTALALESWAPMVASGYEVPAAGQVMLNAARLLRSKQAPTVAVADEGVEALASRLALTAQIARSSSDDFTYLNGPCRDMLTEAARIIRSKKATVAAEGGWSGAKCPRCNGSGEDDDGRACKACAGTGDEYLRARAEQRETPSVVVGEEPDNWFYPIVMPLNAEGHGPATVGEDAVKLTWEVWDQEGTSYGSFEHLPPAITKARLLNYLRCKGIEPLRVQP